MFSSNPRERKVGKYLIPSIWKRLGINGVILRTVGRSMKKKDGHAEILSSKLKSLEEAWEALAKQHLAPKSTSASE